MKLVEFGLGPDPYRRNFPPCVIPQEEADREELDTCDMQQLIVRLLGLSEAAVENEYSTAPITPESVRRLHARYANALPEAWWLTALVLAPKPPSF